MGSNFSIVDIVVAVVALGALVYVLAVAFSSVATLGEEWHRLANNLTEVFRQNAAAAAQRRRRRQLYDEIDAALGRRGRWHDPEEDLVRAAHQTQTIRTVDRKLRESVRDCYRLHWELVEALAPSHMAPVAAYPLVQEARLRVVDLSELLVKEIALYPLLSKAAGLVGLGFSARRLTVACMDCPYFHALVSEAPRPCPALAAVAAGDRAGGVKDAEIVG